MTRYLIDTHIWLWWATEPERLPTEVRDVLSDGLTRVWVSVASIWEMAIKSKLGKLSVPGGVSPFVATYTEESGFGRLDVKTSHALATEALPLHHRDPFDRMLIAQAQVERLALITADPELKSYAVPILFVG